jgi:hypothetical protein
LGLGIEQVCFGLTGMALNKGSQLCPYWNFLKWRSLDLPLWNNLYFRKLVFSLTVMEAVYFVSTEQKKSNNPLQKRLVWA